MNLNGKIIVVTGAGSGIGRSLVEKFVAEGARQVVAVDINSGNAQQTANDYGCVAMTADVSRDEDIKRVVEETESSIGPIDLFCSNAGIIALHGEPWWATSAPNSTWQAMWEIHVMAHVYAARACLPGMLERGQGYFLNTASAAGLLNQIGDAAYSTTKHAAIGFAESLAITHGDDGIKVSVLCPQAVATRMTAEIGDGDGGTAAVDGMLTAEQVAAEAVQGLASEQFLLLPHKEVAEYRKRKTDDYDRWLGGMRKLRRRYGHPQP